MIRRTAWVGAATVVELIRDRTVAGFFVVGILIILSGFITAQMSVVERVKMYLDTGMGGIFLVSVFITLTAGSGIVNREIRDGEAQCILSKPLPRAAWMLGKMAGFAFTLALLIFALAGFMYVFVKLQTGLWKPALFTGALFIFLEMLILSAYTTLFSTITSQYMALFFGLIVLPIGHMVDDLKIYWASESIAGRYIAKILFYVIPNLESFITAPVVQGGAHVPNKLLLFLILYSIAYFTTAATLAVMIMNRKEIE